jgi:protein ImuB
MEQSCKRVDEVACLFFSNSPVLEPLAEACIRFSSKIALREAEAIFIETGRSRLLYSQQTLIAKLNILCKRFGLMPRITFAADAATALATARYNEPRPALLPLETLEDYASPFVKDEELSKRLKAMVAKLKSLGLESLADFLGLPSIQLGNRFPREATLLWQQLKNGTPEVWQYFKPQEAIEEKASLLNPEQTVGCAELEPLLFVLKSVADRVLARLRGRGLRLSAFDLALTLDLKPKRVVSFRLPLPQSSTMEVTRLLHERLSWDFQRQPLSAPVMSLIFRVIETAPGAVRQVDLFSKQDDESEAFSSLVNRLTQRFGPHKVYQAALSERYRPETAWIRKHGDIRWPLGKGSLAVSPTFNPKRPLRLLPKPRYLEFDTKSLRDSEGHSWNLLDAEGPERLCGDWEQDDQCRGFFRDYFRVVSDKGENLWIFCVSDKDVQSLAEPRPLQSRSHDKFFLHGFFD